MRLSSFLRLDRFSRELKVDEHLLTDNPTFCIMPWVHLHVTQYGTVAPCCQAPWDEENSFGNLNSSSAEEIWNGEKMNRFRADILRGKKDKRCLRCYEKEASNWISLRKITNAKFPHHLERVKATSKKGEITGYKPVYFDLRFSNICNFKCRICGPWSSSKWHKDAIALGMASENQPAITHAVDPAILIGELRTNINELEEIYFAGGEPLVMNEHYEILEMLIEEGKTNVKLFYNTNFSILDYKGHDLIALWKQFPNINIAASLDASGLRGEYLRKEQNWGKTIDNRKRVQDELPHVSFMVSPTVYVLNVLHLPDFHKDWVQQNLIAVEDFIPTMLIQPEVYNIRVLPLTLKEQAKKKYVDHLVWMQETFKDGDSEKMQHSVQQFKNIISHLFANDHSHLLPELKAKTTALDELRGERFTTTFPELVSLHNSRI